MNDWNGVLVLFAFPFLSIFPSLFYLSVLLLCYIILSSVPEKTTMVNKVYYFTECCRFYHSLRADERGKELAAEENLANAKVNGNGFNTPTSYARTRGFFPPICLCLQNIRSVTKDRKIVIN